VSRLREAFATGKGFVPYITAGDPDLQVTLALIIELARAGSTVIELGVPFTDPMADGPVIQRASERALKKSFGLQEILEITEQARKVVDVPIVLFSYLNPLLQYGIEKLSREAKFFGVDGILATDLVPEEADEISEVVSQNGLNLIFLVAPTSTDERLRLVARRASGFIYAVSRTGVTGTRDTLESGAERLVKRVKSVSDLPVAVGFGISKPEQVREVWKYADAAVVGSAIVAEIEKFGADKDLVSRVGAFTRSLIPPA
jgi:tryptophan synthase alpha chain